MITYLIKYILCSGLLMLAYKLLFEKEKMHRFNRFYLLCSLIISLIIPATELNISSSPEIPAIPQEVFYSEAPVSYAANFHEAQPVFSPNYLSLFLIACYFSVSLVLLFRFLVHFKKLFRIVSVSEQIRLEDHTVVLNDQFTAPFSFFRFMFLNREKYLREEIDDAIILHEKAHITQKHSLDIIFIELLTVFSWFNPFVFLYRKAIQLNHEFLADDDVLSATTDIKSYQYLLINHASGGDTPLSSRFNYLLTKKRLIMMMKTTSPISSFCKKASVIPIAAGLLFVFSNKAVSQIQENAVIPKSEIPSAAQPASPDLLKEYETIISKYKKKPFLGAVTEEDKNRLQTIYLSMTKEQQDQQQLHFVHLPGPSRKEPPTDQQLESWKNGKIYGLWIDDKRVNNAVLNKYKSSDFSDASVSKLSKNAINYDKHSVQVNLMTNSFYDNYYKEATFEKARNGYYIAWRKIPPVK